jgi:SulP family sulfate permease
VTGPTAAFIPILLPISTQYGLGGLLLAGLMGGLILIGMGLMRLGKLIEYIPYPVTTGFTAGIAVVIATLQLKDLFGLSVQGRPIHYFEQVSAMWAARGSAHLGDFAVGAVALVLLIVMRRATQKVPAPLVVLPLVAAGAWLATRWMPGLHVTTVASKFNGGIPQIPPLPMLPWNLPGPDGRPLVISFGLIQELIPGAFAIAMLGAIESLLSAVVADGMARTKHEPDAEILALGVGNLICPFMGGIPATGAIARTATNIRSGGRTPVASMIHSLTILVSILALAPLIGHLPMAALAALLLVVAWNMSEAKHAIHILKVSPNHDRGVLLVCFALTVAFDMVISVSVGVVLAALLFMKRMAELTKARLSSGQHTQLRRKLPEGVVVYDIAGPLFFGAAQRAMSALDTVEHGVKAVVFDMEQVPAMDATGLVAFESSLAALDRRGVCTILAEIADQPHQLLVRAGVRERFPRLLIRPDLDTAVRAAEEHVATTAAAKSSNTRIRPA